jgi:hypothetical protein
VKPCSTWMSSEVEGILQIRVARRHHLFQVLRHRRRPSILASYLVLCCSIGTRATAQTQPPDGVPSIIHECEGGLCSNWTWNDGKFTADWPNGAIATLTVQSFTAMSVVINRTDTPKSSTAGLTAVYTGQIAAAGNSIVNGQVTWTWRGFRRGVAMGTWTGTWAVCSASTTMLRPAAAGLPYTTTLAASAPCIAPLSWSLSGGTTLPSGFSLNGSTGVISSTGASPAAPQTYTFTVAVTDSQGHTGSQQLSLSIYKLQLTNNGTPMNPGDCASISSTPSMPVLAASLYSNPSLNSGTVTWSLVVKYTGHDNPPTTYAKTFAPSSPIAASKPWNVSFGTTFIGDKATLSYTFGAVSQTFQFCIDGTNPQPPAVKAQLGPTPWFLPYIASAESQFLQFDGSNLPLWTNNHGFGIMQVDPAMDVDLFSWVQNVTDGVKKNADNQAGASTFWANQVSQYTKWANAHDNQPAPPANDPEGSYCTFSYSSQGSEQSFLDAIWIKQYNGAPNGNYIGWQNGGIHRKHPSWQYHKCSSIGCYVQEVCSQAVN